MNVSGEVAVNMIGRLISKLSNKSVAHIALVVSCSAVVVGFLWQQHLTDKHFKVQRTMSQQQTATMLHGVAATRVLALQAKMQEVASMSPLVNALANNSDTQIARQQSLLTSLFPHAKKACLIAAAVDTIGKNACISINFSVLAGLRQAKTKGSADAALLHGGTENAYLLLAQRVSNASGKVVGVLAVALEADVISNNVFNLPSFDGYAELQQGAKKITIATQGDSQWKKGVSTVDKELSGTHWKIAYWTKNDAKATSPLMIMAFVVGVIALMWLLQKQVEGYFFKQDITTIKQQLIDVKRGLLKPQYQAINGILQSIIDDIQDVALSFSNASDGSHRQKESTMDRLSRLGQGESKAGLLPDDDIFDDQIDVIVDPRIFKSYDIRGIVDQSLTEDVVRVIGQAIGSEALEQQLTKLVVGRDGRHSSPALSEALIEGILASGCNVINIGMVPTPLVYFSAQHAESKSGVMVTGSHNPANYNGLKIVLGGKSLTGDELKAIYKRIEKRKLRQGQGSSQETEVIDEYIDRVTSDIKLSRAIKVVIDCGNGVAGLVAPKLFKALGCEVIELYCDVDGDFPNHHPDPSQPENLKALVAEVAKQGAELGLAFDGDGDRLGVVDTMGKPIWPDRLMIMFARDVLLRMPGSVVIYDVKSSNLLGEEISRAGGEAVMWQSGHSLIKNKMQAMDAQLAGEMSGHIFFKERWFGFDDALYAAARLFELLCNDPLERAPTDIFAALPNRVSTPELLVEMSEAESNNFMVQMVKEGEFSGAEVTTIDGVRADYPNGWGLVRSSNTMPGLTMRFEADTLEDLQHIQRRFKHQMLQIKPTLSVSF